MIKVGRCSSDADFAAARGIVDDYVEWLGIDLGFQDWEEERENFASIYAPPHGVFLLAWSGADLAGGVGVRRLEPGVCEMKRLYVYDRFKREGIGRRLCVELIDEARKLGYERMRLDTLAHMSAARALYERLGFEEIEPYRFNPHPGARYMELVL